MREEPTRNLYVFSALLKSGMIWNEVPSIQPYFHPRNQQRRFFYIAKGSLAELITQLEIAHEVGFVTHEQLEPLETECNRIANMLGALIKTRS